MAKDNQSKNIRSINRRINSLNANMNDMYQNAYKTRSENRDDMKNIVGQIDDNIDSILEKINGRNISDITNLYTRVLRKITGENEEIQKSIEDIFNDNSMLSMLDVSNVSRCIKAEDYQYDLICKYMPKLLDALEQLVYLQ